QAPGPRLMACRPIGGAPRDVGREPIPRGRSWSAAVPVIAPRKDALSSAVRRAPLDRRVPGEGFGGYFPAFSQRRKPFLFAPASRVPSGEMATQLTSTPIVMTALLVCVATSQTRTVLSS